MNASEETKVTNVGSQVRRYLDHSNCVCGAGGAGGGKCLTLHSISEASDL